MVICHSPRLWFDNCAIVQDLWFDSPIQSAKDSGDIYHYVPLEEAGKQEPLLGRVLARSPLDHSSRPPAAKSSFEEWYHIHTILFTIADLFLLLVRDREDRGWAGVVPFPEGRILFCIQLPIRSSLVGITHSSFLKLSRFHTWMLNTGPALSPIIPSVG